MDGVAINGVSGGPAIFNDEDDEDKVVLMGVVSAYIANKATGDTLPGLAVVRDVVQMQELVKAFKSVDDAKKKEPPPLEPPLQPSSDKST